MENRLDVFLLFMLVFMFLLALLNIASPHDIYSDWKMPDNRPPSGERMYSCCNNIDCAPRQSRFESGHWYVQFRDSWLLVPDSKVETKYRDAWITPDGLAHGCISQSGVIYCFTPPGGAV